LYTKGVLGYFKTITTLGIAVFLIAAGFIMFYFTHIPETNKFAFESIDSSSCIQCHTDEAVIAKSTFGQGEVVESGGGG
jgi:hypothetical protein